MYQTMNPAAMGMMNYYAPMSYTGGYGNIYQPPQQVTLKENNVLSEAEIKELMSKHGRINFLPTKEELLEAMCTHRHNGGFSMNKKNPQDPTDNVWECGICHTQIDFGADYSPEVIQNMVDYLFAAFNALKIKNNGTISNDIMKALAEGMVCIKRLPGMCSLVDRSFKKATDTNQNVYNGYTYPVQQAVAAMMGNDGIPYMPGYAGMPTANPTIMQSQMPGNPFAGVNPQMGMTYVGGQMVPNGQIYPQQQMMTQPQMQPQYPGQQVVMGANNYVNPMANNPVNGVMQPQQQQAPQAAPQNAAPNTGKPVVDPQVFNV